MQRNADLGTMDSQEAKFQLALYEERHRQIHNSVFHIMDSNIHVSASKGSVSQSKELL